MKKAINIQTFYARCQVMQLAASSLTPNIRSTKKTSNLSGAALHILASHPSALGLILGVSKN